MSDGSGMPEKAPVTEKVDMTTNADRKSDLSIPMTQVS
jgi:hypothetical protein